MENNETSKIIYLETGDDVVSVIEKIQNELSSQINLVVPKRSTLTRSVINFKILKDEAGLLKKKICIITGDKLGQNLAIQAGLAIQDIEEKNKDIAKDAIQAPENNNPPLYNISDLRNIASREDVLEIKNEVLNEILPPEKEQKKEQEPSAIGHFQVSDIIRKNRLEQNEPQIFADRNIKNFIPEKISENEAAELKKTGDSDRIKNSNNFKAGGGIKKSDSMVSSLTKKVFLAFFGISLIVAASVIFIILPKASVSVVSKIESLSADISIVVDPNITAVDAAENKLPGKIIPVPDKEKSQEFLSSGKKKLADKAHGIMIVHNEWSTNPQVLIENTRFESKDGKIFRSKKTIVIPGMERTEGVDVAGTGEVEVEAQEPGESYNMEAGSFTIPGFRGTVKYGTIYGKSKAGMIGGSTAEVLAVTAEDISSARDSLIKIMDGEMADLIKKDLPNDYKIINEAIQTKIEKFETDAKEGDVKDKFNAKINASASVLAFSEKDLNKLVGEIIKAKISDDKIMIPENNEEIVYGTPLFDKDGKMMIKIHVRKNIAWKINADELKNKIKGKKKEELNDIFSGLKGIDSAQTKFEPSWAFWINSVPNNESRIDVSIDK